ncbi:MAG TPA: HepT-like ribonuclease domain-containing protein [bacterium]
MDKLAEEISIDKEYIEKTLRLLDEALNRTEKSEIELSAIGSFLHHCYNGMENILNRILKFKRIKISDSASSHKDLLNVAVEKKIITQGLSDQLDKYRGFRHFFVHAYGVLLEEEELRPLAVSLPGVWKQFDQEIENLINEFGRKER